MSEKEFLKKLVKVADINDRLRIAYLFAIEIEYILKKNRRLK